MQQYCRHDLKNLSNNENNLNVTDGHLQTKKNVLPYDPKVLNSTLYIKTATGDA